MAEVCYNRGVIVPAARMVAERPAPAIRCCGRPQGPDSNIWLASSEIGPQVAFSFSTLLSTIFTHIPSHRPHNHVLGILPDRFKALLQFRSEELARG